MATFNMQGIATPAAFPMPGVQLGFGGALGLTPSASPPSASPPSTVTPGQGTQPSGSTPNAKRPHRVMALSDGPAQPTSPLTNEDVARLLHDLGIKMSTIETYSNSMGEAVTYNSGLLNALVTRVNTIETTSDLTTGVIDQLTEDVKKEMITINEDGMRQDRADAGKDSALRT